MLKSLRDIGNTIVIVEHDRDVIRNADHILEMGPGSGFLGGQIVFEGPIQKFLSQPSETHSKMTLCSDDHLTKTKNSIRIFGANGNNLKNVDLAIPLNQLVSVTGVSGSGKSSLITKTLYPALAAELQREFNSSLPFSKIEGSKNLKNVLLIDQSAIGKSARSSPITYLKAFDAIRNLFASTPESKSRGYTAGTFSLNVDGGRCPSCRGTGYEEIDMMFMDNVIVPCDVCDGRNIGMKLLKLKFKIKYFRNIIDDCN